MTTVAIEKLGNPTEECRLANLTMVATQMKASIADQRIPCGCGCGRQISDIHRMFRCYYCGRWFSTHCAPEHFGGERPSVTRLHEQREGTSA